MKNKNVHAVGGIPIVESRKKSLGIYVHIPFCRSKCEYCDFYSIPGARSKELMTRYLDAVIAHIRESAPCAVGYEVDTVYFGGGTPSFFGATGLSRIFAEIDRRFDVSRDAEVTLEANPDSVTLPMLTQLRRAGFNRISIGVQSDIDEQLKALGRPHNYKQGIRRLTTETGAGQWGAAIAFAAKHFGIDLQVYMVKVSYDQKPYRRLMMNTWGAECIASPSTLTASGRAALERDPNCSGSLGLAISEAIEVALQHPEDTRYCLGSVLNHVILHQTVIGQEAVAQMEMADAEPDVVIGCFGGGSNFAGLGFPFLRKNLTEGKKIRIVAVEPSSCPKLTRGSFQYDFGDVAGFTPLLPMYTLGHDFQPSDIHAGGLRYHGAGSIVSQLLKDGLVEAQSLPQTETLAAGILFAKTEGIIPAPESTHAIAAAIREAMQAKEEGTPKTILFNLSGNGVIDLYAYEQYLAGALKDYAPGDAEIAKTVSRLEQLI